MYPHTQTGICSMPHLPLNSNNIIHWLAIINTTGDLYTETIWQQKYIYNYLTR